jgi:hypothetical protein
MASAPVSPFVGLLLFCVAVALSGPMRADEIAGQADPRFQAALADWLDDDDARSLPVFAALAAEDNRAAQVMLGLIEVEVILQSPWLAHLPRAERRALMRQPVGLSGRSWMAAAAADTPLAAAWIAVGNRPTGDST